MLRHWLERGFWRVVAWVCTTRKVRGITFIYVNARAERLIQELSPVLEEALSRIAVAGDEHRSLVDNNLRFVAATNVRADYVSVPARGYVTAFTNAEATSPHYLAANLIWAAEFIRVQQAARVAGRRTTVEQVQQAAKAAQARFVSEFPDSDQWIDFLASHKP